MWRARENERELISKQRHESKANKSTGLHVRNGYLNDSNPWIDENFALMTTSSNKRHKTISPCGGSQSRHRNDLRDSAVHCSSDKRYSEESPPPSRYDNGLQDDDIQEFLHSRFLPFHMLIFMFTNFLFCSIIIAITCLTMQISANLVFICFLCC